MGGKKEIGDEKREEEEEGGKGREEGSDCESSLLIRTSKSASAC